MSREWASVIAIIVVFVLIDQADRHWRPRKSRQSKISPNVIRSNTSLDLGPCTGVPMTELSAAVAAAAYTKAAANESVSNSGLPLPPPLSLAGVDRLGGAASVMITACDFKVQQRAGGDACGVRACHAEGILMVSRWKPM